MVDMQIDSKLKNTLLGIAPEVSRRLVDLLPVAGFLLGVVMWFVDAAIDVFVFAGEESFLGSLIPGEVTELWMRSLIIVVMVMAALIIQYYMRRQFHTEQALRRHQLHLEKMVEERTRELQQLANFDSLTGIYNRRKFDHMFARELDRARRYRQCLSILVCDIDLFKDINDRYGHGEGDRVLMRIANVLRRNVRAIDIYARWGGEEFILLLPHTGIDDAEQVARKLRQLLSGVGYGNSGECITASFGVSQLQPEDDKDSLIGRADRALYSAKRSGRDQVCVGL